MGEYKTPGVYIKEKSAFGNSVVEAETAIPAFIGYTEKAENGNEDLKNKPWKITSMTEFVQYFGGAPELKFNVDIIKYHPVAKMGDEKVDPEGATLKPEAEWCQIDVNTDETEKIDDKPYNISYAFCIDGKNPYTLYYNLMLFFANGGGTCYIVSVGNYGDAIRKDAMIGGLEKLNLEQEVTMVVIPEAVKLAEADFKDVQQQMLSHCGYTMKNRFALLDIYPKAKKYTTIDEQVNVFWDGIGSSFLSYGAAYYPWLNTSVLSERDLNSDMFIWKDNVCDNAKSITDDPNLAKIVNVYFKKTVEIVLTEEEESKTVNGYKFKFEDKIENGEVKDGDGKTLLYTILEYKEGVDKEGDITSKTFIVDLATPFLTDGNGLYSALSSSSSMFKQAMKEILAKLNLLPPSAAMAGVYTRVDKSRGVWKAPANVALNYVGNPVEDIDDDGQANLNAPMNGKAVNIIRTFRGEGVKVWGARTLDGNSLDWRYINVRRTLLFLEESVKNAARAYVFEPNDAGTWINMKCMIENFLRSVWKRGGLAGATPEDAYEVHVGLGDTMTGEDILEGIMRITVLVAISHPAEFIEITFQQQMQKS